MLNTDWTENMKLQSKKVVNNRCKNFLAVMVARRLPVCDFVYDFLTNPDGI